MKDFNLNVINQYKEWTVSKIKEDLVRKSFPYAVMMQHINGDFNISTFIRNGNAFGAKEIFYWGKKKWDRRGAVGCHNYKQLTHISSFEDIKSLKQKYRFVGIDNNIEKETLSLKNFIPCKNDLYIFGEEGSGITQDVLDICDAFVCIDQFGSVRSLNVGTASGIIMNHAASYFS